MRKLLFVVLALVLFAAAPATAQVAIPNTFVAGTIASPDDVNANFTALGNAALNRTAGVMTGVLKIAAGTAATPGVSFVLEPTTGIERPYAGAFGVALLGTERLLLDANGLSIYGLSLVSNTGTIPYARLGATDLAAIPDNAYPLVNFGPALRRLTSGTSHTGAGELVSDVRYGIVYGTVSPYDTPFGQEVVALRQEVAALRAALATLAGGVR